MAQDIGYPIPERGLQRAWGSCARGLKRDGLDEERTAGPLLRVLRHSMMGCAALLFALQPAVAEPPFIQQGPPLIVTPTVLFAQHGLGRSVALSRDGNTALVGGPGDEGGKGAAWVYQRSGSGWQPFKLVGTEAIGNAHQGSSVALSGDGHTAIVGGPSDDSDAGAAWVYTWRGVGIWKQVAKLVASGAIGKAHQGRSVALDDKGYAAIVGGDGDGGGKGAAWVYRRNPDTNVWQNPTKLVANNSFGVEVFQGSSVALSNDGTMAIVGGPGDDENPILGTASKGAAWLYRGRPSGLWNQEAKLVGLLANGGAQQGWSVALSHDRNSGTITAIVGGVADSASKGAAWAYTRVGGGFWHQQKLVGLGAIDPASQGESVALSFDGKTAIVGGSKDDMGKGAAWVFTFNGTDWIPLGSKLVGTGVNGPARQGTSVTLSGDGLTALVGAEHANGNRGAAWVWVRPQQFDPDLTR